MWKPTLTHEHRGLSEDHNGTGLPGVSCQSAKVRGKAAGAAEELWRGRERERERGLQKLSPSLEK